MGEGYARRYMISLRPSRPKDGSCGSKVTPSFVSVRHTTRQAQRGRPCSKVSSKVGGIPEVFASLRQAPALVMFWTVQ